MVEKKEEPTGKFTAFDEAADYGVMYDKLNIKNISFWTVLGLAVLVVVIAGVISLYNYNKFLFQESVSIRSEFIDYARVRANEQAQLNTYGVIDAQAGIYRVPIDSAITLILEESEQ